MTIITNGFSDIQDIKIHGSGLRSYFDEVITSSQTGWLKPHKQIFEYAVKQADVANSDCLMVGDNLSTDIEGARNAGIDQVFYDSGDQNEAAEATYRINCLLQLKELL